MTLNGIMTLICYISPNSVDTGAHCVKVVEDIYKLSAKEMYPKHVVFDMYHLRSYDIGNSSVWGLNARGVAKYSDFGPVEGYISETMQDRR